VGGLAYLKTRARIGAWAFIGHKASVGEEAYIGFEAAVGKGACIANRSLIAPGGRVGDGERPVSIYISGTREPVAYWGEDRIDIGGAEQSVGGWLKDEGGFAERNHYTPEERAEYRAYVELIARIHRGRLKEAGG
jgi:carbonic anhydrase/acetyltransferase-like protein (isoleucine patch superfamily)